MAKSQRSKDVLLCRIILRLQVCFPHPLNRNRVAERGIYLVPVLLVLPVCIHRQTVDHRIESRIYLPIRENIQSLCMKLETDRIPVCSCRCDCHMQGLPSRIAGALCQNIPQFPVRLIMDLVKNQTADRVPVFAADISGYDLVVPGVAVIHDTFCRGHNFRPLLQPRRHLHHSFRDIKYDRSLLPVCRCREYFCTRLMISVKQVHGISM